MADVRALLRAERAARAPPSVHSNHTPSQSLGKKRKAVSIEDGDETRKRTKAEDQHNLPSGFFDGATETNDEEVQTHEVEESNLSKDAPPSISSGEETIVTAQQKSGKATIDEDEWEAFNREINDLPPPDPNHTSTTLNSAATISAAPMTAAEIEVQRKKEEQRARRARREEELEGEKEDASKSLEDEFEEMEGLEKRVTKLREMRERLRQGSIEKMGQAAQYDKLANPVNGVDAKDVREDGDDDEDDDEGDDWDNWGFGPT